MKLNFKKFTFSMLRHIIALGGLLASYFPIAKYYYQSYPPFGADFYQLVNFTAYIKKYLTFPLFSWKYIWFSGYPTYFDYGLLHSYLIIPLTNFFSEANASRVYLLGTMALYLIFSYLLFWQLTKNRFFSLLLSISVAWSNNLYIALIGGGTAGFFATQMFLPLVLYLIVKYFKSNNKKYLVSGSLALGISFWGHAGLSMALISISAFIVLLFWTDEFVKFFSWRKIKDILLFFILAAFLAGFALYPVLYPFFHWSRETVSGFAGFSGRSYPETFSNFFLSNNNFLFVGLAIAALSVLIIRRFKQLKEATPFFALCFYFLLFEVLFFFGHNPFGNSIGDDRTFFAFTLALGCLVASLWKVLSEKVPFSFSKFFKLEMKMRLLFYFRIALFIILIIGLYTISINQDYLKTPFSYAASMPTAINQTLVYQDKNVALEIAPAWLNTKETNYRLYEQENAVNIWWNIIFDLPIFKGNYYTATSQNSINWFYWVDQTFIGEIVKHFKTPVPVAKNAALFLMDWYAVKYVDNMLPPYDLASYLVAEPGFIKNKVEGQGKMQFLEIGDEFTSPIIKAVNSPNLLVIANDSSYDFILRILGMENINSQYLIPIDGPEYLDEIKKDELSNFDAILLYNYQYKNRKTWDLLEEYVKNGGNLIIDTGSEVKESDINNTPKISELPNVFPIKKTTRQELGQKWELQKGDSKMLSDVNLANFSPLIYEDVTWKLSYAEKQDVRSWGNIILAQKDKAVLVTGNLGQGKVIWSGMNLPYHIQTYLNFDESKLFRNLINDELDLKKDNTKDYRVERLKPENIKVTGENFSGVLIKENAFPGWKASADERKLKIYKAGPDYMYVRVPSNTKEVKFNFRGDAISWVLFILGIVTLIFILVLIIFGDKFFKKIIDNSILTKKIKKWWERDEG